MRRFRRWFRTRRPPDQTKELNMRLSHDIVESNTGLMIALIILVVSIGGLVEIVPLFFQRSTTEPVAGLKPYPPLQLAGTRHLHPRGLQQLPLANDSAVSRRDRALRSLLGRRRVRLRPSVPVGQQAHRTRSGSRWRPLQRRVARAASGQSAPAGSRIEHACLPMARQD